MMPLVTSEPRSHLNGDLATEFVDVANTTGQTYQFKATQNFLKIRNVSDSIMVLSVGMYTAEVIQPWGLWSREVTFSSFTIQSNKNSQQFVVNTVRFDPKAFGDSALPGGGMAVPINQRLHLATDERWIYNQGHLSDLIRLQWLPRSDGAGAKPALVWCDEEGNDKAAIIAHDKANNPDFRPHRHISIEVDTGTGELHTVMEFPFGKTICEVQLHQSRLTVNGNYMRVSNENGANGEIRFCRSFSSNEPDNLDEQQFPIYDKVYVPRWAVRGKDNASETGTGNTGSDFRIVRFADDGSAIDAPVFIKRSSGNVGIGNQDPQRKLDINDSRMRLRSSFTPSSATATGLQGDIAWDANYMYVCVATNTWKRTPLSTW